jgi:glycosyltransferase involved in cell wall biosynthesis
MALEHSVGETSGKHALLVGYRPDQAAYRYRMGYLPAALEAKGWEVRCERFPSGRYGLRTWERRGLLRWASVTVFQTIKFSPPEALLLRRYARRCVFDLDDAIYVRRPRVFGGPVDHSRWRHYKFAATCRAMDAVVVGNSILAAAARPFSREVVILPTTLDPAGYHTVPRVSGGPPTIVWVGNPENIAYLEMVRSALERLSVRHPGLRLRVISSAFPEWPNVRIERIPWSPESEIEALATADIGIMPLTDDDWSRGKCAFKLLQYMAASLPCVASPVGANHQAIIDGKTGFLAASTDDWETALDRLISDQAMARAFGNAGRRHLDTHYSLAQYTGDYERLLTRLIGV